ERVVSEAALPDSIIVQTESGALLWKSAAVVQLLGRLGGGWRMLGWLVRVFPLTDVMYDRFAAIRHRIVARPKDACPLLPASLRSRFLP
ncbi:MAG: DUF393 domain-containing protein, partial [Myxococcales bacterium]|nr:DUF393 domain-containing protein [Myxococcales bacterium]